MGFEHENEMVELLKSLALNDDLNEMDKDDMITLYWRARGQNIETMERLILISEWQADVNAKDNEGKTALHHAVMSGNVEAIEKLMWKPF